MAWHKLRKSGLAMWFDTKPTLPLDEAPEPKAEKPKAEKATKATES